MMRASSPPDITSVDAVRSALIVENVVGNAWATDAAGSFTYVTSAALAFLSLTMEELNSSPEPDALG